MPITLRLAHLPAFIAEMQKSGVSQRQLWRLYSSAREAKKISIQGVPPTINSNAAAGTNAQSTAAPRCTEPVTSNSDTKPKNDVKKESETNSVKTTAQPKSKLSSEVMRQNMKDAVFTRYFDYVKNYDKVLEKNFPSAMKVYRVFFDGVKDFFADMKSYLKISRIVHDSPQGLKALNRKELELYMQMPRDMVKVAPALIGSSLPMVGYAIFPLVFMFPRTFLTTHFWTLQQRSEFQQLKLQERLSFNRAVFRCLQAKLKATSAHEKHEEWANILGLIGSGFHPPTEKILSVKDIFTLEPYSVLSLTGKHIKSLHQMHGLPGGLFKRHRLIEHAFLVHNMDLAITREGGVHNMHVEAIRYSCFLRGLNPANLGTEQMIEWLRNWIQVSTSIQEQHITLFLHLPILLGYNHPNNWQLVYGSNKSK